MFAVLNLVTYIAFGVEVIADIDGMLNKRSAKKTRIFYIVKFLVACVLMFLVISLIYKTFAVTEETIMLFVEEGVMVK